MGSFWNLLFCLFSSLTLPLNGFSHLSVWDFYNLLKLFMNYEAIPWTYVNKNFLFKINSRSTYLVLNTRTRWWNYRVWQFKRVFTRYRKSNTIKAKVDDEMGDFFLDQGRNRTFVSAILLRRRTCQYTRFV